MAVEANNEDSQDILIQAVLNRRREMQELLAAIPRASKTIKDRLRIIRNHNSLQYYIVSDKEKPNGTFLPQMQIKKAKTIAQRDYNAAAAAILKRDIATINNFLAAFHPEELDNAFTRLHPGRRALVTPVRESDEDFIARWRHLPYTGKPFEINAPEHYTASGVRVRSKSEIIIADALDRAGTPYRYEYPTSVKGWGTLYPDFTCLNVRTRKEIIWEHFGLMGNPDYAENAIQKIAHYAASGYILGKNLVATFEIGTTPLSTKQVQTCIKAFFG